MQRLSWSFSPLFTVIVFTWSLLSDHAYHCRLLCMASLATMLAITIASVPLVRTDRSCTLHAVTCSPWGKTTLLAMASSCAFPLLHYYNDLPVRMLLCTNRWVFGCSRISSELPIGWITIAMTAPSLTCCHDHDFLPVHSNTGSVCLVVDYYCNLPHLCVYDKINTIRQRENKNGKSLIASDAD